MFTLSACGGAGSPVTTEPEVPIPPTEPNPMRDDANDLIRTFTDPTTFTSLPNVPMTGSSVYTGFFYGEFSNSEDTITDELIGNLEIDVRFGPDDFSVTGTISNLFDEEDNPMSGSIDISVGQLDRSGNPNEDATFSATATGVIIEGDGDRFELRSRLEGDFLGANAEALGGAVFGRVDVNSAVQDFDGGFISRR